MIDLFNIPHYHIDTSKFNHFLHGDIVEEFESNFRDYVGAKYSCSFNSATNAIFLAMLNKNVKVNVPSMIPPVVCNALLNSGNTINFTDDIDWVGDSYVLHEFKNYKIIDSAQKVEHHQFIKEANDEDLMVFSFYPTKPISSCDGGIIVSNDKDKINWFKEAVMNGMSYSPNNWERKIKFPGFKMYMNSIQCYVANENLKKLNYKKEKLKEVRELYNKNLNYNNSSEHLYRINVNDRDNFISIMKGKGITCGIHYQTLHNSNVYGDKNFKCPISDKESQTTVSIPYHESLSSSEVEYIIDQIKAYTNA